MPHFSEIRRVAVATLALSAFLAATPLAQAKIKQLNATCPMGIEFHADDGGYVYINGKEAKLKVVNAEYYEATHGKTTVSVASNPDGSYNVSYTASGGANGICEVK